MTITCYSVSLVIFGSMPEGDSRTAGEKIERDDGGARGDKEIKRASETNLSMELQYLFDTMEGVVYHKR